MVVLEIKGGLGNQLFQYAFAKYLSNILGQEMLISLDYINRSKQWQDKNFSYRDLEIHKLGLELQTSNQAPEKILENKEYKEAHEDTPLAELLPYSNIILRGYWQDKSYANSIRSILQQDIQAEADLADESLEDIITTIAEVKTAVCVHIRRGDYITSPSANQLNGVLSSYYYANAFRQIASKIDSPTFFIFSDEIEWAKKEFANWPYDIRYVSKTYTDTVVEDFIVMQHCEYFVIANSSLSWWSAWLKQGNSEKVFAPENWFKDKEADKEINLYNHNWNKISSFPLVSVVLPTYNDEKYIEDVIFSILQQTYTNIELIVIVDGATDNTLSILQEINDKRLKLEVFQENQGIVAALNHGLNTAQGKYILRIDGDDYAMANRISKQVEIMEKNPSIVVSGTAIGVITENSRKPQKYGAFKHNDAIKAGLYFSSTLYHPSVIINRHLAGSELVYVQEYQYAEDFELWTRLAKLGKLENIDEVLTLKRNHKESISYDKKEQQQEIVKKIIKKQIESDLGIEIDENLLEILAKREKSASDVSENELITKLEQIKQELVSKYKLNKVQVTTVINTTINKLGIK